MRTLRGSFRMMEALGVAAAGAGADAAGAEAAVGASPTMTAGHRVQPYLSTGDDDDDDEEGKGCHERYIVRVEGR